MESAEDFVHIVNGRSDLDTSRWREEFLNTKNAERWMARTLGHSDESMCKLLKLEDELKVKYGKVANLSRDDHGEKPSYSEIIKNGCWEEPKPKRNGNLEKHSKNSDKNPTTNQVNTGDRKPCSESNQSGAKENPSTNRRNAVTSHKNHEQWLTPRSRKVPPSQPKQQEMARGPITTCNRFDILNERKERDDPSVHTVKRNAEEMETEDESTKQATTNNKRTPSKLVKNGPLDMEAPKEALFTPSFGDPHVMKRVTISANPTLIPDSSVRAKTRTILPEIDAKRNTIRYPTQSEADITDPPATGIHHPCIETRDGDQSIISHSNEDNFKKAKTRKVDDEKFPSGSLKKKFHQPDNDFWGRPKQRPSAPNRKIEVCKICKSDCCIDHTVAPLDDETDDLESVHFRSEVKVDNLLEHSNWPTLQDDHRIREKPSINEPDSEKGSRHRIVSIINGSCVVLTLDTGSFASIMSLPKARSLRMDIIKLDEPVDARSATGSMKLTHFSEVSVDLGTIKCKMKFLLIDSDRWKDDLVLIGSNTLKALNMEIYFKEHVVKIHGILPVPMHNSNCSAKDYIQRIKSSYLSLSAIRIRFKGEMTIKPYETRRIDVFLNDMDVVTLSNTVVFFKGVQTRNNLIFNDLLVEKDYPWQTEPLKVTVSNPDPVPHDIRYGDKIGTLKPLINRHLLQQLPGLELEDEVFLVEDIDEGMVEENMVATLEEGEITDDPLTEELERSIDSYITGLDSSSTSEKNKEIIKQVLMRAKAMLKTEENHLVPEFKSSPPASKKELDEFFRIPESVKSEINLHHDNGNKVSGTRLTTRDDLSPEEVDALVEESQLERDQFWTDKGKDFLLNQISFGSLMSDEEKKEIQDIIWKYKKTFAGETYHLKASIKIFAAEFGKNEVELPHAAPRPAGAFAKEVFSRYISALMRANLVKRSACSARSNAFLVSKPKPPPGTPEIRNMQDLTPDLPEKALFSRFRLVNDLSKVNLSIDEFSYPMTTPRDVLNAFSVRGLKFFCIDVAQCFFQLKVTKATSDNFLSFIGPSNGRNNFSFSVCPMGAQPSSGLLGLVLSLIYGPIFDNIPVKFLLYADNMICFSESSAALKDAFEKVCEANVAWNLCVKASDLSYSFSTLPEETTAIEILGLTIISGTLSIPPRRQRDNSDPSRFRTRQQISKLLGMVAWYHHFSPAVSGALKLLRDEMKCFKSRKNFVVTDKMKDLIELVVNIFVSSPGLYMITSEEYNTLPLLVLVDSSQLGWGGCLVALKQDTILPIRACSKAWGNNFSKCCSNRLETLACYLTANSFWDILLRRKWYLLTDSNYAKSLMTKEIMDIPQRLKFPILSLRENFSFRTLFLAGKLNSISDLLSRFLPPDFTDETLLSEWKTSLIKTHMRPATLPRDISDEIRDCFNEYKAGKVFDVEDTISKELKRNMPEVLQIEEINSWKTEQCSGTESCCTEPRNISVVDEMNKLKLITLHKVNKDIKENLKHMTTPNQFSRLQKADYVMINDDLDSMATGITTLSLDPSEYAPDKDEQQMPGKRVQKSRKRKEDNASKDQKEATNTQHFAPFKRNRDISFEYSRDMEAGHPGVDQARDMEVMVIRAPESGTNPKHVDLSNLGLNEFERKPNGCVAIYRDGVSPMDSLHDLVQHVAHLVKDGDESQVPGRNPETWGALESLAWDDDNFSDGETSEDGGISLLNCSDPEAAKKEETEILSIAGMSTEDADWWNGLQGVSIKEKVERAQYRDPIILSFIDLVSNKRKPSPHEVQARGDLAIALQGAFEDLEVRNDKLYIKSCDSAGDTTMLLVVPCEVSGLLIQQLHEQRMHSNTWRLLKEINSQFFLINIKSVAKFIQQSCRSCILSSSATMAKRRKIKCLFSRVGHTCAIDVLYLPASSNDYRYILTVVDLGTGYLMTAPMKNRDGETTASNFKDICYNSNTIFKRVLSDPGKEFSNTCFQAAVRELGAVHLLFNDAAKGVTSAAEAANRRITNLLRRSLGDKEKGDWTSVLRKTTYALNASSFLYAKTGTISSPAYLQHARHPYCPSTEISELTNIQREQDVKQLMAKICKERNIDAPSIHQQVSARKERFKVKDKALVFNEWIVQKRRLHSFLLAKLNFFWTVCEIIEVLPLGMYRIRNENESSTRVVHSNLMKRLPREMVLERCTVDEAEGSAAPASLPPQ